MRPWLIPGVVVPGLAIVLAAALPRPSAAQPSEYTNGTVVHFGDSFVDAGLRQALGPKFRAEKTRYIAKPQTSSYLGTWARADALLPLYWTWRPSLFVITLGANEGFADPPTRAGAVHAISRGLKGVPCVWMSIPYWKGVPPGMNEMMRKESAPCRFFDAGALAEKIPRQSFDGRHPTIEGGAMWAEAFWTWLMAERDPSRGPWALKEAPASP
jgi:hypothetical protein